MSNSEIDAHAVEGPGSAWPELSLDLQQPQIRLLQFESVQSAAISCSLTVHSLQDAPDFSALSYAWGEEASFDDTESISCNGVQITVRPNLYLALDELRKRNDCKFLWIDAISIDQANVEEKNVQVSLMGSIYSTALKTIIWLGPTTPGQKRLSSIVTALSRTHQRKQPLDYFEGFVGQFADLYSLPYFTRAWVLQEFALAKNVVILRGDTEFDWEELNSALEGLRYVYGWSHYANQTRSLDRFSFMTHARTCVERGEAPEPLFLIMLNRAALCQDPRDKIYSMLGIFSKTIKEALMVKPDYDIPVEAVYVDFASQLLRSTSELGLLCFLRPSDLPAISLPSWASDFRTTGQWPKLYFRAIAPWLWKAALDSPITNRLIGRRLVLSGHKIDTIADVADYIADPDTLGAPGETLRKLDVASLRKLSAVLKSRQEVCPARPGPIYSTPEAASLALWQSVCLAYEKEPVMKTLRGNNTFIPQEAQIHEIAERAERSEEAASQRNTDDKDDSKLVLGSIVNDFGLDLSLRMARTELGYYCNVPWQTEVGDSVVLCAGGRTPFVTRRVEGSAEPINTMLGGCYVHGVMFGEAWKPELAEEMWFE